MTFTGRSLGVIDPTGPTGQHTDEATLGTRSILAAPTGNRVGTLRSLAQIPLPASTAGLAGLAGLLN